MKLCPACSMQVEEDEVRCRRCGKWTVPEQGEKRRVGLGRGRLRSLLLVGGLLAASWSFASVRHGFPTPAAWVRDLSSKHAGWNEPGSSQGGLDLLRRALEDLALLEEAHFAEKGAYSASPPALGFAPPEGWKVSLTADGEGWAAMASSDEASPTRGCAIYQGRITPPTTPLRPSGPGRVECSR